MVISIASGKGGTGKTTIAVNLAKSLDREIQLLDCDVEEPNAHLFLKPKILPTENVTVPVPIVDVSKCTFCGTCGEICQFNAIVVINENILVFPELCHSCAGCWLVCPERCIARKPRKIGVIAHGQSGHIELYHGQLNIGEALTPPLIKAVKEKLDRNKTVIIDAPPGSSCPVIEAIKGSDFVLLATEPTPFGLNDLKIAVEMVRELKLPLGVVINRSDIGNSKVTEYCIAENIAILMEIPNDRKIAEAYSTGEAIVDIYPAYRDRFLDLYQEIERRVNG